MEKTKTIVKLFRAISEEAKLTINQIEMLKNDLRSHRAIEWKAIVDKHCTKETKELFEELVGIKTKRLHISMAYTFVGDTGIDIPLELLEGKTENEQYEIAYQYAQEHLGEIPVANNAEYVPDSDNFDMDDIEWEE